MDFTALGALRRHLEIKHHIPGRMRVKFSPSITKDRHAMQLARTQSSPPPGVKTVRLNWVARSVVIEYDAQLIPHALLEELATTRDDGRASAIVEELHDIFKKHQPKE